MIRFFKTSFWLIIPALCFIIPIFALAQGSGYVLLEPSAVGQSEGTAVNFVNYAKGAFNTFLILVIVLAIVYLVWGGLSYMLSGIPMIKVGGKERMGVAIQGLVLALVAWLILNTINPNLLRLDIFNLAKIGDVSTPIPIGGGGVPTSNTNNTGNSSDNTIPTGNYGSNEYGARGSSGMSESEVRDFLAQNNIRVNRTKNCAPGENGMTGQCTTMAGTSKANLNGLVAIRDQYAPGTSPMINGGTEIHSRQGDNHSSFKAIDIDDDTAGNKMMNGFINDKKNGFTVKQSAIGSIYTNNKGQRIIKESNHWHLEL